MQIAMKLSIKSVMGALAWSAFALHALAFAMTSPAFAFTAYVSNEKGNSISIIDTDKLEDRLEQGRKRALHLRR
jgi:nicotinic acid phosphoribosyltransferase